MSTTTSNSQQVTLVANAEQHLTWSVYYENIVITNVGTTAVWVCTDGTTATVAETGADSVLPGQVAVFPNRQPKLVTPITSGSGSTNQKLTNPSSGSLTYMSLISSGTPQVVVSPQ